MHLVAASSGTPSPAMSEALKSRRRPELRLVHNDEVVSASPGGLELSIEQNGSAGERAPPGGRFHYALLAAVLLHASPLVWLAANQPPAASGAGGASLEAISIEMVEASALEALRTADAAHGGSHGDNSEQAGTAGVDQPEIAAALPRTDFALPTAPPEAAFVLPEADTGELAANPEQRARPEPDDKRDPRPPEREPDARIPQEAGDAAALQAAQAPSIAGGAPAKSSEEALSSDGKAAASAGALAQYAIEVRLALGRVRPAHAGRRGRAVVDFTLSETGRLDSVHIAQSSGNVSLDDAALAAVRAAHFPLPPLGASPAERHYVVPFEFE